MCPNHHGEFLEWFENIWYLNTYTLLPASPLSTALLLLKLNKEIFKPNMKFREDREEAN
jgi:hypothetical protein